jgi:hypothetical protein
VIVSYGRDDNGKGGGRSRASCRAGRNASRLQTPAGQRSSQLVAVPDSEAEATKAFVAFLPYEDDPRWLVAFDADGDRIALQDLPRH